MNLKDDLLKGANDLGVEISDRQSDLFFEYLKNLKQWNEKINLTAIKDDRDIIISHFLDSLSVAPMIQNGKVLLDIGSGAGFPGIPLKLIHQSLKVTLLDSVNKKVSFMNDTIRILKLADINAIWGRAEDIENKVPRGSFDYVITRAVGSITDTLRLSSPYLATDATIILMKGRMGNQEWDAVAQDVEKSYELIDLKEMTLPFSDSKRFIIALKHQHS